MVGKCKSKQEKFQVTKWQAADEQKPVREMERVMDVELFLGLQDRWAEDSPHCLVILYEMFRHAAAEGQKEAEWIVCWGQWQNLPQLNPEVGIPAVQLVGPETTKEELLEVYLEVYKLHRLPGSPPGEPAISEEVLSSLPDHQRHDKEEGPTATAQPHAEGPHSSRSCASHRGRKDDSVEGSLATVHDAHQKVLATVSTLEEEIEKLSHNQAQSQSRAGSKSRDHWWQSREGKKKRCCQVWFEDQPAPSHSTDPQTEPSEQGSNGGGSDLDETLELKPMIASFLTGSLETSKDKGKETSPEPLVVEFSRWVAWKAKRCKTPEWWTKLLTVPGKDNHRKLAREVRASFGLPWWMQELGARETTLQAPPAPPCLCRQKFMWPSQSIYAGRDIRKVPREKVVAYARALQRLVEQNNLPAGGEPCWLAKTMLELRKEVKWYLSFTNEEVFWGWPSPRKKRRRVQRPFLLQMSPKHHVCWSHPWKREPQKFWDRRRYYTHANKWWLPGRSPNQQRPQGQK